MTRKNTSTTSFGSPGREGHDSSAFYSARLYDEKPQVDAMPYVENPIPADRLNTITLASSENMSNLPDSSVHLMVTSPPYNVGKDYDENLTLEEYLAFLRRVWGETYRVLVPGGRACINAANLGRKPYIPLHLFIARDMVNIGFLMRGEIIWDKAASASTSTAWGSWQSASNPTLRDTHEYILVFSKGNFRREKVEDRENTISKEQFLEWTKSVWSFASESARKIGHPAPFPVELPYRCIQLYTYSNEVVLDPFMGSGQTALAALRAGRKYVGYELNEDYLKLAQKRIDERV
ncbi:MAG: site-specific DNA-methyltransferase [Chloroflexi bacterium]|nr:site-specific DNA-methyltransferase [Chloroflexota bacterium]